MIPTLESVLCLATYRELYKSATIQELSIGDEIPNVSRLQELTRQSEVLNQCELIQNLIHISPPPPNDEIKDFIFAIVQTSFMIGRQALTNKTLTEFRDRASLDTINQAIETLTNEQVIKIVNPNGTPEEQSICLPV